MPMPRYENTPVRAIPNDVQTIPGFRKPLDSRTDEQKELDTYAKKLEAERAEKRRTEARQAQIDAEDRVAKLIRTSGVKFATRSATRSNATWAQWSGIKEAMRRLDVAVIATADGGYILSRTAATGAGEDVRVSSLLQSRRLQADRLCEVIEGSFGVLMASEKPPRCSVKSCRRDGEHLAVGDGIICDKHRMGSNDEGGGS